MLVTIRIENENHRTQMQLVIQEILTIEQIDSASFDIVCRTLKRLREKMDHALEEQLRS